MPKVYGYLRVSHKDQADSGNSIETQRKIVEDKFAELKRQDSGLEWGQHFCDPAVSAYKKNFFTRPEGCKLNGVLKRGDVIIFSRVDRAFRNLGDLVRTVETWQKHGIRFVFCDYAIDPETPLGKAFLAMMGIFAQLDSDMKSERIKAGIATKKRLGHVIGSKAPTGFKRYYSPSLKHDVYVEKSEFEILFNEIARLRESGMGFIAISDEIEDFMAARQKRKSYRGTRSRYEYTKSGCRRIYETGLANREADDSCVQSDR